MRSRHALSIGDAAATGRPAQTVACVSMHKTGSTALLVALREAGYADAMRIHALGPKSRALLNRLHGRSESAVEWTDSSILQQRLSDPSQTVAVVTCIRDPIAQLISGYFQFLADRTSSQVQTLDQMFPRFVGWVEKNVSINVQQDWFQDNIVDQLGIDIFSRCFDPSAKSLRVQNYKLRLLCLRHEDGDVCKEIGLRWLVEHGGIRLRAQNVTAKKPGGSLYSAFKAGFSPPKSWLDGMYGTEVVRHFYSDVEIDAMRSRWMSEGR